MENGKSKIRVIDVQTNQVLLECELSESEKAYEFAASLEDMGLDVKVLSPTISQTLSSSLGLSQAQVSDYEMSIEEEMEDHAGSCCFEDSKDKKIQ